MFAAPSRAPDLVTAYNTSSTSLVVKWTHVPKDYLRGRPIGYNITYYTVDFKSEIKTVSVNYTTNITNLMGLDVYTKYGINVSVVSSGGVGPTKSTFASTGANTILLLSCLVTDSLF